MLPMHSRGRTGQPAGVWTGTVTKLAAGGVWVNIAHLNPNHDFGPMELAEGLWTAAALTTTVVSAHSHAFGRALAIGDRVLVAFVEGRNERPVVICRLP